MTGSFSCQECELSVGELKEWFENADVRAEEEFFAEVLEVVSPQRFRDWQENQERAKDGPSAEELAEAEMLAKSGLKRIPWMPWDRKVLLQDQHRARSTGRHQEHLVRNGVHLVHSVGGNQIDGYPTGSCIFAFYGMDRLLGLPPVDLEQGGEAGARRAGAVMV